MQRLFDRIRLVSQHRHTVLISGENGSGKSAVARAIHNLGPTAGQAFLALDCGSLTPQGMASELFGHLRGACAGATANKVGVLEGARRGTVLLDEIAAIPLDLQFKFLQALQDRKFQPLGGHRTVKLTARILSTSSHNMASAVRDDAFRQDLYFRLNVVILRVPPLRERKNDIPELVGYFVEKHRRAGQSHMTVSDEAMRLLLAQEWPGNVAELERCVQNALERGTGSVLRSADLAADLRRISLASWRKSSAPTPLPGDCPILSDDSLGQAVETGDPPPCPPAIVPGRTVPLAELERQAILHAVLVSHGDRILAAQRLGIGKTTVYRKLKEYGTEA
jgi:DNA-binding NtrC family response regulator